MTAEVAIATTDATEAETEEEAAPAPALTLAAAATEEDTPDLALTPARTDAEITADLIHATSREEALLRTSAASLLRSKLAACTETTSD